MTSVRINNNSNYLTGYAAVNEPTCGFTNSNEACNQYGTEESVTQPWFVHRAFPWFSRGSHYSRSSGAGVFAFANGYGSAFGGYSFHIVLSF